MRPRSSSPDVTVSAEIAKTDRGLPVVAVKIAADSFEINVFMPPGDVQRLAQVRETHWEAGALQIGESAGARVFWSCDSHVVSILIGQDDETWDVGVSVPESTIAEIMREALAVVDA